MQIESVTFVLVIGLGIGIGFFGCFVCFSCFGFCIFNLADNLSDNETDCA